MKMNATRLTKITIYWKPEGRKTEAVPEGPGKMGYIQP
jgi:hypothetical protein